MIAARSLPAQGMLTLLFLRSRDCRLCMDVRQAQRLMLLMEIDSVPHGPDYLVGLMNYRGDAVPVIDLGLRLGLGAGAGYTTATTLLLATAGERRAALVIDDVLGVRSIPSERIRGDAMFRDGIPPVQGLAALDDGGALLLDLRRILDIDLSGLQQPLSLSPELRELCREAPL